MTQKDGPVLHTLKIIDSPLTRVRRRIVHTKKRWGKGFCFISIELKTIKPQFYWYANLFGIACHAWLSNVQLLTVSLMILYTLQSILKQD